MNEKTILCANAIIIKRDKILLVKRKESDNCGNLWSIPGGTVEDSEKIFNALNREILEELGITIKKYTFFEFLEFLSNKNRVLAFYYYAKVLNLDVILSKDELSEFNWFNLDEIETLNLAFNQNAIVVKFVNFYNKNKGLE